MTVDNIIPQYSSPSLALSRDLYFIGFMKKTMTTHFRMKLVNEMVSHSRSPSCVVLAH